MKGKAQSYGLIGDLKVTTMNESIEEMKLEGVATRVLDHSLLQWDIMVNQGLQRKLQDYKNMAAIQKPR